ncbi:MAG: hypothetical protein Q8K62_13030 [Thiobacillus sp.]|nr:hypothetical protein [Thiobacillus sp.]
MRFFTVVALTLALGACSTTQPLGQPGIAALPEAPPPPPIADERMVCPLDVRLCADGSYVSRTSAGCAFAACPGARPQ